MRILHVAPFYEPAWSFGGMARAAAALCRALARSGHDVSVVTARLDASHPVEERRDGVRVLRFEALGPTVRRLVPWAPRLRPFLDTALTEVDVVHLHGHRTGLAVTAARVCRQRGVPYLLQPHGTYPRHAHRSLPKALFDVLAGDRIVADAAALLAVSEAEARDLPRPARVVPNGVEPVGHAPAESGSEGAAAPRRRRVLFVGSDAFRRKRADVVLRLLEKLPDVGFDLVGSFSGRFRARLGRFADRVRLPGVLHGDALAAAYATADVVVHPGVGEAFGLVPFEAALHGTAAVVAGGHGCGEWFGRAGGCVVPPDDPAALVAALRARLLDPARARAEARSVAEFAARELTWDAAGRGAETVYREILGAHGQGRGSR